MKQETVKVDLIAIHPDEDILRFHVGQVIDVSLNSPECQNSLKKLFAVLLKMSIDTDISFELKIDDEYPRGMYKEVCTTYVDDLKRELDETTDALRRELA